MDKNKLSEHLPQYIQDYREIREILDCEQGEFDRLWIAKDQILNNAFVYDADESGVGRYEKILGMIKKPSDTLDERKFHIIVKMNEQLPYTIASLKENLAKLCGVDGFAVVQLFTQYQLEIKVALTAKSNLDAVKEMVERVIPCNMGCVVSLIYNQHSNLGRFTQGSLGNYTQYELRNEVLTDGK